MKRADKRIYFTSTTALKRLKALRTALARVSQQADELVKLADVCPWWQPTGAVRDEDVFPYGPLRGNQSELSNWIFGKKAIRRLHNASRKGEILCERIWEHDFKVWFPTLWQFREAESRIE